MAIPIKNAEQIKKMRVAGQIVAKTHEMLESIIKPGITTRELDKIAADFIKSHGATPSFKNYRGFPANICTSVNDEVIHGIPGLKKLLSGDIISIDIGAYMYGFHGDAARTYRVGEVSSEADRLIKVTEQSFFAGIRYAKAGCHLHHIGAAIEQYVEANGFSVVREYIGHGVGKEMHEDPQIPNFKQPSRGPRLAKGMTLAIEPMVNLGTHEIKVLRDGYTVATRDGKYSAHYENTVHITDGEPDLLTIL